MHLKKSINEKKNPNLMKSNSLNKNCDKWSSTDPQKAILIPYINCEGFDFCYTEKNEINLKIQSNQDIYYLHSQKGALEEAESWFNSLAMNNTNVLYIYGVGLGYYYLAAKKWLKSNDERKLIFIEDSLPIIHCLFELDIGIELLNDSQVNLYYLEAFDKQDELFNRLYWDNFMTPIFVSCLQFYKIQKASQYEEIQHKLYYDASIKDGLLKEYLDYGAGFYKNFYLNMLSLEGAFLGNSLFKKFQGVPAIICGAGPSLEKNLKTLSKLTNKALIFAGGSALNALNAIDLQPHFGAAIDPNEPQFDRLSTNTAFEVPFFYRNRLLHAAFKTIHGPRLYITGSGGYDTPTFFEERLDIQGEAIEEGHNVVNFCLEIASALGCNPIIFVGMDLAYTGMKAYASGVVKDNSVDENLITSTDNVDLSALVKPDIYGKPVYTLWKWIAEADWIGDYAINNPDTTVINATEGGIGFPGIVNMNLKEVEKNYLKKNYDLKGHVHSAILSASLSRVKLDNLKNLTKELKESLERCVEDFSILIEETELMKVRVKKEKNIPFPLQSGRSTLFESDLAEESGYQYVLQMFNEAYTRVLNRELQDLNRNEKISEKKKVIGKLEILIKRFAFLRDVALVNIELINFSLSTHTQEKQFSVPKIDDWEQKNIKDKSEFLYKGKLLASSEWSENGYSGISELFYPNGSISSRQFFVDGVWDGEQKFFYPDGQLKTCLDYNEGKLVKAVLYHADGSVKLERSY